MQAGLAERNPLEGVVTELAALMIHRHDPAAGAQHHTAIGGATGALTVFTAGLDVVAVQFAAHRCTPFSNDLHQYTTPYDAFPVFFSEKSEKHSIAKKLSSNNINVAATDTE